MLKKLSCILTTLVAFASLYQIDFLSGYSNQSLYSSEKTFELKTLSTITNLAQAAQWLNEEELAVGRWDGTITIFSYKDSFSLSQALVPPSKQGITMLERINDCTFASSNDSSSIALWEQCDKGYSLRNTYHFDNLFGSADCAKFVKIRNREILLTGHSEGYLLLWKFSNEGLSILSFINLQSDQLLDSPYKLWNIRSILPWKDGIVVTASEDGDLCMIDLLEGEIVHRQKYNKGARRGINRIFISGDYLFVSNCSVGPLDRNLWLYRIEKNGFVYLDSKNLIANEQLDQVFSFDVGCISKGNSTYFFCTTGEGLLWYGQIKKESLHISNFKKGYCQVGAALAIHPLKNILASISYDIQLLELCRD